MSDTILKIIPATPGLLPTAEAQERARQYLGNFLPNAGEIKAVSRAHIEFIDAGGDFESVNCPICDGELANEWWQDAMSRASTNEFLNLDVELPCCGIQNSLATLKYVPRMGFARFSIEVTSPGIKSLPFEVVNGLERILGCPVNVIVAHL